MYSKRVSGWTRIGAVALVAAVGLSGCGDDKDKVSSGALCAAEVTFQGIDYEASAPESALPENWPTPPVRGRHIGRTERCTDHAWVDANGTSHEPKTVWLEVYEIKGIAPTDGIFVESFGPMAPITQPSSTR